jgi:uncharacterized repeat protein (TIGR01451 family)
MAARAVLVALCLAGWASAQAPSRGPAPLLFVRFEGKARVTFYQGSAPPRSYLTPEAVGLRPGYCYRARIDQIEGHPELALYPTLEVHGCLILPPRLSASSFPVSLRLSENDLAAIAAGSFVSKVYALEHPDRAEPKASEKGHPMELDLTRQEDLWKEARNRGRVILAMHFGPRQPEADELARVNVPGTILFPGQKVVGPAASPPHLMMAWPAFIDPKAGPRPPEEEMLHDGGDRGEPAAHDGNGKLYGVGPEDTVAEWTDWKGRRNLTPSNRVCLCVPRYIAFRKEVPIGLAESYQGPRGTESWAKEIQVDVRTPVRSAGRADVLRGFHGRMRPAVDVSTKSLGALQQLKVLEASKVTLGMGELLGTQKAVTLRKDERLVLLKQMKLVKELSTVQRVEGAEEVIGTAVTARVQAGTAVVETQLTTRDLTVCCECPGPIPIDRPLVLVKCADKVSAQPGDVVTFTLRFTNGGLRPLTDVAVTDSLSGRLEYVPGSAQSDREAVFTQQANEAGSSILRWEVGGTLQPGDSGRVKFQARVR